MTVRHLLAHTSGIPNYIPLVRTGMIAAAQNTDRQLDNSELLEQVMRVQPEPDFAPGTKNNYSNTGYLLLAMLIERLTGYSFHEYLEREIFRPFGFLRLTEYRCSDRAERLPDYAVGYFVREDGRAELPFRLQGMEFVYSLDALQGDGNFHSSAAELLRWDQLLRTEELLRRSILEEAYRPVQLSDGTQADNGLGWFVNQNPRYGSKVDHSGYWPGYSAEFVRYLKANVTVIFLSNEEMDDSYKVRKEIMEDIDNICFEDTNRI